MPASAEHEGQPRRRRLDPTRSPKLSRTRPSSKSTSSRPSALPNSRRSRRNVRLASRIASPSWCSRLRRSWGLTRARLCPSARLGAATTATAGAGSIEGRRLTRRRGLRRLPALAASAPRSAIASGRAESERGDGYGDEECRLDGATEDAAHGESLRLRVAASGPSAASSAAAGSERRRRLDNGGGTETAGGGGADDVGVLVVGAVGGIARSGSAVEETIPFAS